MSSVSWSPDLSVTATYSSNLSISIGRSSSNQGSYSAPSNVYGIAAVGTTGYSVTNKFAAQTSEVGPGCSGCGGNEAPGPGLTLNFSTSGSGPVLILVGGEGTGSLVLSGLQAQTLQNQTFEQLGNGVLASIGVFEAQLPSGSYSARFSSTTTMNSSGESLGAVAYDLSSTTTTPSSTTSTTTPTQAAPISWTDAASAVGTPPSARADVAMAYDAADGYTVLFGGQGSSGAALGDTWVLNGGEWSQISPSNLPSPRSGEAMTYDAADGYVLLFGGYGCGGLCGDSWAFKAGQWTELRPSQAPSPRAQPAMTYDSGDGYVLLFGGGDGGATVYGDTWVFKSGQWSEQSPSSSPSVRGGASLVDDVEDGYVVMFGGSSNYTCVCGLSDTWEYSGGKWSQLSPSNSPGSRYTFGFAYDPAISAAVFFGGWNANGGCGNTIGDTWAFSAGNWTELSLSSSPPARNGPAMDYDPQAGGVVLFGGDSGTCGAPGPTFSDTWELGAATTTLPSTTTTVISSASGFLVVRQVNDSTLAPGFGTSGGSCGWPAGGQQK